MIILPHSHRTRKPTICQVLLQPLQFALYYTKCEWTAKIRDTEKNL